VKVIIAGSRTVTNPLAIESAIQDSGFIITEVVSGGARGADMLGEQWAKANGIPVKVFPADWNTHGKSAGAIRNGQMAKYANALIAVCDGITPGTQDMIRQAKRCGLKVYIKETY